MTPEQYYFPYLFNLDVFNKALYPFDLSASIAYEDATNMPDELLINHSGTKKTLHSISFGKVLMIDGNHLLYWETDTNLVDIAQLDLKSLNDDPWILNTKIDLSTLGNGKNSFTAYLDTEMLVTYAKKDSIFSNQPNDEKYTIVIVEKEQVNIIPFDWFNKTFREYDYTWPATARLDSIAGKLYGQGILLKDFCIDLDKASL